MLILYNPPSNAQRKPNLPMSLLALGAVLEGKYEYIIVDGNLERDPLTAVDRAIRETGANLLGITVMPGPQLSQAVPLCRQLKTMHPNLIVVWGGYFPTQHYDVVLKAPYVDYVVRGHGEFVFKALVDALRQGDDLTKLPGMAYKGHGDAGVPRHDDAKPLRTSTSRLAVSNAMAPIPHPEHLPTFPYQRVPMERYVKHCFLGTRTLAHHSSYGCPFFCNFCAVVNMVNGGWLAQSAKRTADTVQYLYDHWRINAIEFYDNNFFVNEERTVEIAERIRHLDIAWWGEARIDTLLKYKPESWRAMAEAGLKMIFMGAESGSDETLKRMNKGGTVSTNKTIEIARLMKSYGIIPEFSFILGNPPDPEEDTRSTIEFIRRVKQVNSQSEIIMYVYTPVPLAGELYEQSQTRGFQFPETLEEWITPEWLDFSQRHSTNVPWLNDPLRRRLGNFERVLNAYYPTATDINLRGFKRWILRGLSAWRYHLRLYGYPLELRALHRFLSYQRPETSGF